MAKNPPANEGDTGDIGSIPGLGRSPGEGNGNPLQYSCWEIPWTEEPGRLQFMGSQRVGHDLATKQHHQQLLRRHLESQTNFFAFTLYLKGNFHHQTKFQEESPIWVLSDGKASATMWETWV